MDGLMSGETRNILRKLHWVIQEIYWDLTDLQTNVGLPKSHGLQARLSEIDELIGGVR